MLRITLAVRALVALVLAAATPAFAQSLEVSEGSPLSIETLTVRAGIEEGVALVDVEQTFRNATDRVQEGTYRFRLPEDAVVHSLSMWMNGKEKQGQVLEAAQARRVYDSIVRKRLDPALLEQTGWRSFKVSVFPIPARDTVRIRLRYTHVLPDDLALQTLEIPLPEKAGRVGATDIRVDVRSARGLSVLDSPSHSDARVQRDASGGSVRWTGDGVALHGPFQVRSKPAGDGFDLALLAHRPAGGDGFFLIRVVPKIASPRVMPRDVVFVVDRSGSMRGPKIEQARQALLHGLTTLRSEDRFSVLSFATEASELGQGALLPVNGETLASARTHAKGLEASGGTNIDRALELALELRSDEPGRLFLVVFLTDGDASVGETNSDAILARFRERNSAGARLFAFGVGNDVRDFLLTRLARESRGAAAYVRENENLEVKLSALYDKVRRPVLVAPEITVDGVEVDSVEPQPLPDVFQGSAVVLAGRFKGGGAATLRLRGRFGQEKIDVEIPASFPTEQTSRPHVAQLWARMRIDRLLDDLRVHGMVAEIRDEIVDLGVTYQVVSPYTSFLVVEDGVHIPDARESARVPEGPPPATAGGGPSAPRTGGGPVAGGGSFRGPGGEVPPDSREPSDQPPPASGGGPTTPGGETGGPTTGGGDVGGPTGPTTGGGGAGRPAASGGGGGDYGGVPGTDSGTGMHAFGKKKVNRRRSPGYENWTFWWMYTAGDVIDEIRGEAPAIDPDVFRDRALPALRARLAADENFAIRSHSALALARFRDTSPAVRELLQRMLEARPPAGAGSYHRVVDERAALAFGLMGDRSRETRDRLLRVLEDRGRDRNFVRPFAAISLGLLGKQGDTDGAVTAALFRVLAADEAKPNVKPAALIALGLLGDRAVVPELLFMLEHKRASANGAVPLSRIDRAYVVDALGRIGYPGEPDAAGRAAVVEALRTMLVGPRPSRETVVRRSAQRSLGHIAAECSATDLRRVVDTLVKSATWKGDASERHFALISLGRIAARSNVSASTRKGILDFLQGQLEKGTPAYAQRPFAGLALALALRGDVPDGPRERALATLRRDTSVSDAAKLALGLAGDPTAVQGLVSTAADRGESYLARSSAIEALGLLGAPAGRDVVRQVLLNETDRDLRVSAARAAGLLGDRGASSALVDILESGEESQYILQVAAKSLGRVGDDAAIARLCTILSDTNRKFPDITRAMAALALGRMAVRGQPDPLARALRDFRYRAFVPALTELSTID